MANRSGGSAMCAVATAVITSPHVMPRVSEFGDPDDLSELLLRLTVSSTVYCFFMSSPWGFRVPSGPVPAFHILTSGGGWMEIDGQTQPVRLSAGDLVILPRG